MRGVGRGRWKNRLEKYREERQPPRGVRPLYFAAGDFSQAHAWRSAVKARGGEYILAIVCRRHADEEDQFIALATVRVCGNPGCRWNHTATPDHVVLLRHILARRGIENFRISAGWDAAVTAGVR